MNNLFVYGTLQHGQSRNHILKGLAFEIATLKDHEKLEPPSLGFPFIIHKEGASVEGEVYFNVPNSLLEQIDIIEAEGELYHRIIIKVLTSKREELEAFVYYPSKKLLDSFKS
ncbi:MAG: gamma-glutamylcyclotransferase family protein [Promethearchaeota archaeon]